MDSDVVELIVFWIEIHTRKNVKNTNQPVSEKAPWILGTNEIIDSSRMTSERTDDVTPGPPLTDERPDPTFNREICNTKKPLAF